MSDACARFDAFYLVLRPVQRQVQHCWRTLVTRQGLEALSVKVRLQCLLRQFGPSLSGRGQRPRATFFILSPSGMTISCILLRKVYILPMIKSTDKCATNSFHALVANQVLFNLRPGLPRQARIVVERDWQLGQISNHNSMLKR